jgi:hypothetical protein
MNPGWMLDEKATAGRENLDVDHVARYDSKEDAGAAAEVALMTELGLSAYSIVVEIGVGHRSVQARCRALVRAGHRG